MSGKKYITEYRMIKPGQMVLAGVSGGNGFHGDAALLKRLEQELGFSLAAVHVNHGIRGEEALRDERLVEETCKRWGRFGAVLFYDVPTLAREQKKGVEEAAREARKTRFKERLKRCPHRSAGSGRAGRAWHWRTTGRIWPRRCFITWQEEPGFGAFHHAAGGRRDHPSGALPGKGRDRGVCKKNGIVSVTDSTNLSDAYTRNRIRHHILPALKQEVNTRAAEHMAQTAVWAAQAEDYLSRQGEALGKTRREDGSYLLDEEVLEGGGGADLLCHFGGLYRLSGQKKDFTALHVRDTRALREKQPGRSVCLPKGFARGEFTKAFPLQRKIQKEAAEGMRHMELPVPGRCARSLGSFSCEIFLYQGEKIEEKSVYEMV